MNENTEVKNAVTESKDETKEDPYAYLDRGEFSSENFKIQIKNLPKFYGVGELRKYLNNKLNLKANKVKSPRGNSQYAFVCFRNEEDRDNAIKVINESKWKGCQLKAFHAKASADPLVMKRKEAGDNEGVTKKHKFELPSDLPQHERIKMVTTPLADTDYTEQLKIKQENIREILKDVGYELENHNLEVKSWIEKQREKYDGLPCELLDIQCSDLIDGYRNKCEFTVGIDHETNLPTVGFRIGAYVNGVTGVAPVDHLRHINESMKKAAKLFQEFIRSSDLQPFNPEYQKGHFRQVCMRTAPDQLMVIVGIHPQDLSQEKIADLQKSLVEYFTEGEGKDAKVTCLCYQEMVKKNPGQDSPPIKLLWGESHIYETLLGLKFRISPEAFFQINTKAAEILYESAIELAEPTENSSMIDICCGTGTIGLCFAKKCGQVLGIELVAQSITDAKENANINNILNSEFFTGKAEEILDSVCFKTTNEDVFAVVDPPRAGLHHKAVRNLRKITKINRLIYISCNPKLAQRNFLDLGRPESKTLRGDFFVPVKAVAVDLFPHTRHCELVMCFKRWELVKKEELKKVEEGNPS